MNDKLQDLSDKVITLELAIREHEREIRRLKSAKALILDDVLRARCARERNHTITVGAEP